MNKLAYHTKLCMQLKFVIILVFSLPDIAIYNIVIIHSYLHPLQYLLMLITLIIQLQQLSLNYYLLCPTSK